MKLRLFEGFETDEFVEFDYPNGLIPRVVIRQPSNVHYLFSCVGDEPDVYLYFRCSVVAIVEG